MSGELSAVLKGVDLSVYEEDLSENDNIRGNGLFPIIKTARKKFILTIGGSPIGSPAEELVAVLVKSNKNKSRKFYSGTYNPKETCAPDCTSRDGVRPDANAVNPQSSLCANCPRNVKKGPCRPHKRTVLCFLDPKNNDYDLYRLDVPADSIKDLATYGDELSHHNVPHSAVVTKITMDDSVEYAKFKFERVGGLLPIKIYKGLVARAKNDPIIPVMLESTVTFDLVKEPEEVIKEKVEPVKKTVKKFPWIDEDEEEIKEKVEPVKKTVKKFPLIDVDLDKELDAAIDEQLG